MKHEAKTCFVSKICCGVHFNSWVFTVDFTWNCCRLLEPKALSRNSGQFKWVTREMRYHVSITELVTRNFKIQVVELVVKPKIYHLLYFSGDHQLLQNSSGIKSLYHWGWKSFIHCLGSHNLWLGKQFKQNYLPGKPPGLISPGHFDRVLCLLL